MGVQYPTGGALDEFALEPPALHECADRPVGVLICKRRFALGVALGRQQSRLADLELPDGRGNSQGYARFGGRGICEDPSPFWHLRHNKRYPRRFDLLDGRLPATILVGLHRKPLHLDRQPASVVEGRAKQIKSLSAELDCSLRVPTSEPLVGGHTVAVTQKHRRRAMSAPRGRRQRSHEWGHNFVPIRWFAFRARCACRSIGPDFSRRLIC